MPLGQVRRRLELCRSCSTPLTSSVKFDARHPLRSFESNLNRRNARSGSRGVGVRCGTPDVLHTICSSLCERAHWNGAHTCSNVFCPVAMPLLFRLGRRGFTRQSENSKRAHLRVPAFSHHQNSTRRHPREGRKNESCGWRGKKRAKCWAVLRENNGKEKKKEEKEEQERKEGVKEKQRRRKERKKNTIRNNRNRFKTLEH